MSKLHDDAKFKHVNYHHTDVRVTFRREFERLKKIKVEAEKRKVEQSSVVRIHKAR